MSLPAGTRLGPYEVLSPLGAGGMGEVYRARDTRLGRDVALKVLPEEFARDPERVRRFEAEARSASVLSDSHIVAVFDVGEQGGVFYIATELVEGSDLRKRLDSGPVPAAAVAEIGAQIAEGLSAAHERGIVHRDLKPENILMTRSGLAKIADFGLAKQTGEASGGISQLATAAADSTGTGVVMGTVAYMSPEQARGARVDFRSDQFSLGLILYELLTGRRAFARNNAADTLSAILRDEPEPLRNLARDVPEPLARIVHRCLSKEAAGRYGSTGDLAHDLRALRGGSGEAPAEFAPRAGPPRRRFPWRPVVVAAVLAGAAAVFFLRRAGRVSANIESLAILPFTNSGGKPDMEFLSDGITESLINKVSQVAGLKVISRASAFYYKGKEIEPEKIAKELKVKALLTGHVLAVGDSLSVGVELVDAADGRHLWGDQYNRKMEDVIVLQGEIASQIAEAVRGRLTGEEKTQLQKRPTEDAAAYQAYLRGKYLLNRVGPEEFDRARAEFEEAVRRDPRFALAYAGIAVAYGVQGFNGFRDPAESWRKSRENAKRAIELDDTLPDGHVTFAAVLLNRDWAWEEAEKELRRAMELGPSDLSWTVPEDQYSFYLEVMGRFDEAISVMKKAQQFDPLSANLSSDLAQAYYFARRYDLAIAEARRGLELEPGSLLENWTLGEALTMQGKYGGALEALHACIKPSGEAPQSLGLFGWGCGRAGRAAEANEVLRRLHELSRARHVEPLDFAMIHLGLGETNQAFEYFDQAVADRNGWLIYLNADPMFDPIRSDPRFAKLVARVGLPPGGKV